MEGGDRKVHESNSLNGFTSSDVLPLDETIPQASWRGARTVHIKKKYGAMLLLLEPLKRVTESVFKVSLGSKETRKCFPVIVLYCCNIFDAKTISAALNGTGRQCCCFRCQGMHEKMMLGRRISSRVAARTVKTQSVLKELQERAGSLAGKGRGGTRREVVYMIGLLLSEHSLAKRASFLDEMCGGDQVAAKGLYWILTFEHLQNLRFRSARTIEDVFDSDFVLGRNSKATRGVHLESKKG